MFQLLTGNLLVSGRPKSTLEILTHPKILIRMPNNRLTLMINVLRSVENNGISKTFLLALKSQPPNGVRYPLVGGTR